MKKAGSQKIAGLIALGFLVLALLFFLINYNSPALYFSLAVSIPAFFALSFFLVKYYIDRFIYSKLEPIYKTLNSFRGASAEGISADDILEETNKRVEAWVNDRAAEISNLKKMERYRKEFIGNVSHELKTPVFNIQGYILTLLDGGLDDPNINELFLKRTEKSIDRMISIIEDLEAISKLESGEMKLNRKDTDLLKLIEDVFEMQEIRAKEKKITLRTGDGFDKPVMVNVDKERMHQVLSNLIVNSINYGKKHGETVVNVYDMDTKLLVEIRDNGIGISEKHQPRIFERFYRVDKSRSREQGGTGLGLSIVKHIIEAHGQSINVSSEPGKGTSFTFTLQKSDY